MLTKRILSALSVLFVALNAGAIPQYRVNVSGFVVARDKLFLLGNAANKDRPKQEAFIVRLEKHEPLSKDSLYIKVYYHWSTGEPTLPSEFFKSSRQWRFVLARVPGCDGTVNQMATTYNENGKPHSIQSIDLPMRLDGAQDEEYPLDRTLPCYLLEADNVSLLKLEN